MDVVGISQAEQDGIFQVVAAILHLGNVEFAKGQETDAAEPKDDKSRFHLKTAAELFMCDEKALEDSLCKRIIVTRDESITKSLDPDAAALSRDALSKIVYSKLFDWLVDKINIAIGQDSESKFLIGVLDIYGFESFKTNSFEQFCINLTNEKLQQHFNQHVFKMEQEEYKKEEIDWSYIEFIDNQDILDLIEKKPRGIIALLDEACMFPRSTHATFAEKLYQTFKDHKRFSKPKLARTDFTICHYAGDVTYQTELFLDKNKDYVVPEHQALLSASECSFVSSLFPPLPEESSKSSKFSSIGSRFKQQLQALLETLSATEPHYIRCVKPNNALKPGIFENNNVLQQLRCGGVMEAIRISCAGFPSRKMFREFMGRFAILAPEVLYGSYNEVTASKRILEKSNLKGYQIGKTKVFLRAGQMAELDARRSEVLGRSASVIQRKVRMYLCRKHFILLRLSATQIQALCRGQVARHHYEGMRREVACLNIQKHSRKFLARKAYKNMYLSAISIQAGMRGMAARNELLFRKQTKAATVIQRQCRRFLAKLHFQRLKKAAITSQCAWRAKVARKELRKLKMAAKEAGALQEAKNNLEKEVEELTWRLQLEQRMRVDLEESKNQESARLHTALQKMQFEFQETKKLLIKECEAAKYNAEQVDELMNKLTAENEQLKIFFATMPLQDLVSSLEQKIDETERKYDLAESKNKEIGRLQTALQNMQLEFQETEELLVRELEAAKNIAEQVPDIQEVSVIDDELVNKLTAENEQLKDLVSSLEQKIDETERKYDLEESKTQEIARLQNALQKMQLEFQETEELLMKELEAAKHIAEQVPVIQEVPVIDDELVNKLTAENEQLKALVSSLEQKIDETERKYDLEESKTQEVARLQTALQKMQLEFQETEELLIKEREAAKNIAEQVPVILEVPVIDDELVNKLTAENEQLKALVSSLEQKIDGTEMKYDLEESKNQDSARLQSALQKMQLESQETKELLIKEREAVKNIAEQVPVIQEVPVIDDEWMNKLTAENEQLKALVSSLEQKIDETERKYELEESKNQDSARLQTSLPKMQLEFQETKELLIKECEAAKNICEQVPVIQGVPIMDDELMNKLTAENEQLKALVSSLEQKIDETERKYEETNKLSEERLKQSLEAELKIIELKTTMQSLEEKILDMETEDQILRQQALLSAPSRKKSEPLSIVTSTPLENGHAQLISGPPKRFGRENSKLRRSHIESQQESVDALIKCVTQNLGFRREKPVAACTIYRCLLHWRSFEAERTSVFDRLIQMIGSALEEQDNNDHMAYWLSNTSALLSLLQRSLKASGSSAAQKPPPTPTSFFSRMTQTFRSSSANLPVGVVRQVEAKYPALLFKQQLTAYVEKIYGIIRDNLKKDLSQLTSCCIQVPRTSKGTALQGDSSPASHWQSIIECLNRLLCTLKENFVPQILVQKIFTQIFAYINVQLFNSLLLRRECCTFSNGEYLKSGLAEFELWCAQAKVEYAGSSWDELKHTRQTVGFLVIREKSTISYDEITNDLCNVLSVQQLYRVCTLYRDDNNNTQSVSPEVISSMKLLMTDDSEDDGGSSFLLDDDSSIPFSVEDITDFMQVKEFSDVKPAAELIENPAFQFLLE
ncbi:hypothetical protein REPUB_Repub20aG0070100 [Reevesia pubescens]